MKYKFSHSPSKLPDVSDDDDDKDLFSFYGLCAYYAQVLEQNLVNLAAILSTQNLSTVTAKAMEKAFLEVDKKTLGKLIRNVKESDLSIPKNLENELGDILQKRNYLVHHFFSTNDRTLFSRHGRLQLINELREMTIHFQEIDKKLEVITLSLYKKIGITEDIIEQEIERMISEGKELDQNS